MIKRAPVLSPRFYGWYILAAFITHLVHEGAHYLAGKAFGFDMRFGLNAVSNLSPAEPWQQAVVSAAGPLVTILQALVAFVVVMSIRSHRAFAFVYIAAFMRLVATGVSFMHPNDEARVSLYLGMGMWMLPLMVSFVLVVLAVKASRKLELTWKDQLFLYLTGSIMSTVIVGLDRFVF